MSQFFEIQDTSDSPLVSIEINAPTTGITAIGTVRIKAAEAWTGAFTVKTGAITVDRMPKSAAIARGLGGVVVDGRWIEARVGAGAWTPIGGHPLDADVDMIATDSGGPLFLDVELRLNIPANTEVGAFCVLPFVLWY